MSGYPHEPGFKDRDGSTTSQAAAAQVAGKAATIRARALTQVRLRPQTAEQIGAVIGVHFMVVRARMSELRAAGEVVDSGARGDGALGGRVIVWRTATPEERAVALAAREAAR